MFWYFKKLINTTNLVIYFGYNASKLFWKNKILIIMMKFKIKLIFYFHSWKKYFYKYENFMKVNNWIISLILAEIFLTFIDFLSMTIHPFIFDHLLKK
jgi:hypothetical protein